MILSTRLWKGCATAGCVVAVLLGGAPLWAQEKPAPKNEGPHRKLAPGVMTTVEPARQLEETYSRHDMLGLLAVNPDFTWAKHVSFRHDIWVLQFKFKPLRMIDVDVPQKSGVMERKKIWYLIYSVTNAGQTMHPVRQEDGSYKVEVVAKDVKFVPEFLLRSHEYGTLYADKVIPVAIGPIQLREDPSRRLNNTAEMLREIKVGETVWGVATWENIDPRIDRFSVYVKGLTNAYRWEDSQTAYKKGDPLSGRKIGVKTLKVNFWRPGDEYMPHEGEIRLGIPGQPDYDWVYLY
jgi:hypothetical protein